MDNLKIVSYNCRGLNDVSKRADVFKYLKSLNAHIYCLQDCHFTSSMEKQIYSLWDGECYFSFGTSNSRGVCILFNKCLTNLNVKVHNQEKDTKGNVLILDLTIDNNRFTLCTLYGPNNDTPLFYSKLFSLIETIGNESYILCGDFNLVLDVNIDYANYKTMNNNKKSRELLSSVINEKSLVDTFRVINGDAKCFTWRKPNTVQQARLDFFLTTNVFSQFIRKSEIHASYKSDHSPITLELNFSKIEHGKGPVEI
jgi:exonuclease III